MAKLAENAARTMPTTSRIGTTISALLPSTNDVELQPVLRGSP